MSQRISEGSVDFYTFQPDHQHDQETLAILDSLD